MALYTSAATVARTAAAAAAAAAHRGNLAAKRREQSALAEAVALGIPGALRALARVKREIEDLQ